MLRTGRHGFVADHMDSRRALGNTNNGALDAEVCVRVCHTLLERQCPHARADLGGAEVSRYRLRFLGAIWRLELLSSLRELSLQRRVSPPVFCQRQITTHKFCPMEAHRSSIPSDPLVHIDGQVGISSRWWCPAPMHKPVVACGSCTPPPQEHTPS